MFSNSTNGAKSHSASTDLVLKPRDLEILSAVHQHRFLTTDLIWRLVRDDGHGSLDYGIGKDGKKRPTSYGFGLKALYKRLAMLHKGGFLARHYVTDQPYGASHGSPRAVYGLGFKAVPPVADFIGASLNEVRRLVEANEVKSPYLRHALEVSSFRITLTLACRESHGQINLMFWEQGIQLRDSVIGKSQEGSEERFPVYPDAFFGLSVHGRRLSYFLEIDRGTMPIVASSARSDLRKKFIGYKLYADTHRHSHRYFVRVDSRGSVFELVVNDMRRGDRVFDPSLVPIKGFRALFVIPGSLNQDGSPGGRLGNVLSALPTFGKKYETSSLFWFASYEDYMVENPTSIFDRIWVLPNPTRERQSLIEGT